MTTMDERKARREERLRKEAMRERVLLGVWTGIKCTGAILGMVAAGMWLAVVMWDNVDWSLNLAWAIITVTIGAVLFKKAFE